MEETEYDNAIYHPSIAYSKGSGIIRNSFYDTSKDLGTPKMSEEEFIEYKRRIGMLITEDYDESINSLIAPTLVLNKKE